MYIFIDRVAEYVGNTLGWNRPPPEPKDIREFGEDFNFTNADSKPELIKKLDEFKFSHMVEVKTCDLYEDQPKESLYKIMDKLGNTNNITNDYIDIMKLSVDGGRAIKAHEMFVHGMYAIGFI